eukprot:CAMPEP_0115741600 /NCGR_PEP_ID=MMETSP0272-20121206/90089_1 /TAXON_ID=71861 /ORGANISM="Scrippsiella trochoidea, Strain CCMP3099" /LENGTH=239 /DNA_ID=CAMNT_0003186283 /DNA_START=232 /DNA_END=950 /DNA_ORIENTATION=-
MSASSWWRRSAAAASAARQALEDDGKGPSPQMRADGQSLHGLLSLAPGGAALGACAAAAAAIALAAGTSLASSGATSPTDERTVPMITSSMAVQCCEPGASPAASGTWDLQTVPAEWAGRAVAVRAAVAAAAAAPAVKTAQAAAATAAATAAQSRWDVSAAPAGLARSREALFEAAPASPALPAGPARSRETLAEAAPAAPSVPVRLLLLLLQRLMYLLPNLLLQVLMQQRMRTVQILL